MVYAIIPARSGSKGLEDKNIKLLAGKPLMVYSIEFAKCLGVDKIICSTDSFDYANIARQYGAEVPFLRSSEAASSTAMEHHILQDLFYKFKENNISIPELIVWLRPTFVFRDKKSVLKAIEKLQNDSTYTSARTVIETEARLYNLSGKEQLLFPNFDDSGKSMIRRQDIGTFYKVYSTDVFRFSENNLGDDFLGNRVFGIPVNKICGLDIDDETDFRLVEALVEYAKHLVDEYLH